MDCSDDLDDQIEAKPYQSHSKAKIDRPSTIYTDGPESDRGNKPDLMVNTFFSESRHHYSGRAKRNAERGSRNSNGNLELRSDILLIEESPTAGFAKLNDQKEIASPNLFYPPARHGHHNKQVSQAFTGTFSPMDENKKRVLSS